VIYRFIYRGEVIKPNSEKETNAKLARLFRVSEAETAQLFEGKFEFIRENLTLSMADDYQVLFHRIGAKGVVEHGSEELIDSNNDDHDTHLTSIAHASNSRAREVQSDYGYHVRKQLEQSTAKPENEAQATTNPKHTSSSTKESLAPRPEFHIQKKSIAANWLRVGGLAVAGTIIADSHLQSVLFKEQQGIDIGVWPLLLAHIPLLIGCYHLAKEKQLSPVFRIFGLLSFAGLSILMLLPAKGSRDHKIGFKEFAITVLSCTVFLYWFGGQIKGSADTTAIYSQLDSLRNGRQEYPSALRQDASHIYHNEQREMRDAMLEVIDIVKNGGLRPDDVTALTEKMMAELGHYIAWRRYQIFKHHSSRKKLPESLRAEQQEQDQAIFKNLLRTNHEDPHPRFHQEVMFWTIGAYNDEQFKRPRAETRQLNALFPATRDYGLLNHRDPDYNSKKHLSTKQQPKLDLGKLYLPQIKDTKISMQKDHAVYEFISRPMQGKTLAIGFFFTKHEIAKSWSSEAKTDYRLQYSVINADLPATSMSAMVTVFRDYKPNFVN